MGRRDFYEEEKVKKIFYIFIIALILSIAIFLSIFVMYNKKMKQEAKLNIESLSKLNGIVENEELEQTSYTKDKTVQNSISNTENTSKVENKLPKHTVNTTPIKGTIDEKVKNEVKNEVKEEVKKLSFMAPASGEIIKDFSEDNLVYSNTLEEWTTHTGIDISAEKTSIVVASEEGTVESIKNDPRYGLTITISHTDGFKTMYSNLLTSEFVKEGQKVEKGQTIATVGESASFEIADDSHLHFEMYKDGVNVNPTIYLK